MTTRAELLELIANGENSGVEFKRDGLRPESLAKELVAFSNLEGGMVLLGVEDDGKVSGLTRDNAEEWVMTLCRDKIRPAIVPFFETVRNVRKGKDVAVVRVPYGQDVHALWHNNSSRYLVRVGSQSREASQEELARLFQRRSAIRAELRPVRGATLADLDQVRLEYYFRDIRQQDLPEDEDGWRTLLTNTELMTGEGEITTAALLLFGENPNRFLPYAGFTAVAQVGKEKDYDARERTVLRGPMMPKLANGRNGKQLVENGLVDEGYYFVRRNTPFNARLEGARRIDRPAYPPDAVREGLANALIHRDYLLTGTDIELVIYADRLEIVSPGRLPNGVTPEHMRTGTRTTRNELIKDVMRDYGYLESIGMGIPRKIIKGMREHNGTEPELIAQDERFTLRLFA